MHPYDYSSRLKYLLKMGDVCEIEKLYCLEIYNQLEKSGTCESDYEIDILISEDIKDYIDNIKEAYFAYQGGQYDTAICSAKCIENIYPIELLANALRHAMCVSR